MTRAAARAKRAPRPALTTYRERVRRVLDAEQPMLALLATQVANAARGSDPEAALRYVAELRESCDEILAACRRSGTRVGSPTATR